MSEAVMNPCDVQEQLDKYVGMVQQKQNDYYERCGFTHSDPDVITVDLSLIHI